MLKKYFNYELPQELIAQSPVSPRDSSRLLVYNRKTQESKDEIFYNIINYFNKGDVLVINTTRVILARLHARNNLQRNFEILLLKRIDLNRWEALLRPARKAKIGSQLTISRHLKCSIESILDNGIRVIKFEYEGVFEDILSTVGQVPLPPYIKEKLTDSQRYQTIYSKIDGSSAAPTAGLHFTESLLERLKEKGVEIVEVLLHVGLGTFRPVKSQDITDHKMHEEYFEVTKQAARAINKAKEEDRRIIATGTTSVRVLESIANEQKKVQAKTGYTDIFIYPPYKFKIVDALLTNFHLPESTLIMLVSAFAGRENVLSLYQHAISKKYRFFSFGDAMFIE